MILFAYKLQESWTNSLECLPFTDRQINFRMDTLILIYNNTCILIRNFFYCLRKLWFKMLALRGDQNVMLVILGDFYYSCYVMCMCLLCWHQCTGPNTFLSISNNYLIKSWTAKLFQIILKCLSKHGAKLGDNKGTTSGSPTSHVTPVMLSFVIFYIQ